MWKIFKYSFYDLIRSRWSYIYFLFFAVSAISLLYLSNDITKAIVSLMNIILILCPLIGTIFGVMYYYNSRDFVELLLAQPIKRSSIFFGQYLGIAVSLSLSFLLGIGLPFLSYGVFNSPDAMSFITLIFIGVVLTFIFIALAFIVALKNENRIKGFGIAIVIWLFLAVIYDGLFLLSLFVFSDYPLDKMAIAITLFNPIDLCRILIILKLDIAALLGYTGAVFNKFFGTSLGVILSATVALIWIVIPSIRLLAIARSKDF